MSHKIILPPKEELEAKYAVNGATLSSLAKEYGTSHPTVTKWMKAYSIPIKSHAQASQEANRRDSNKINIPDRDTLIRVYDENSLYETLQYFSIGQETLYQWLDHHGIQKRTLSQGAKASKQRSFQHIQFSKSHVEQVYSKYHHMGLTADALGISYSHLKTLMAKYDIDAINPMRSKGEISLYDKVCLIDPSLKWEHSDKSTINPFELDIVCHEKQIAIEYNGLFWHSETFGNKPDKKYHQNKVSMCQEKGYQLITVFENDDVDKVINLVRSKLGMNERVFARDCVVAVITPKEASEFHKKFHLHGAVGGSIHYGLFHEDGLLMVLTVGKSRFSRLYEWECGRMTVGNVSVVGGASKLFNHFFKDQNVKSCVTYADLRYGEGEVYSKCGFSKKEKTSPNYWYFHKDTPMKLFSRVKFQKHKMPSILAKFDSSLTEYQNMIANGYDRIWDCGNVVWVYEK